jgi:hypothetical protein
MHETLAPNGFFPVPKQNRHFFKGSSISTIPLPLQTRHSAIVESKSNGSLPLPPQNVHLILFDMLRIEPMIVKMAVEMILLPRKEE